MVLANNITDGIKQLVEQGKQAGHGTPPPPPPGDAATTDPPPGGRRPRPAAARRPPVSWPPPRTRVQTAIAEVKAAQASGDFERYGRALKALDEAMTAFQQAQRATAARRPRAVRPPRRPHRQPAAAGEPVAHHPAA